MLFLRRGLGPTFVHGNWWPEVLGGSGGVVKSLFSDPTRFFKFASHLFFRLTLAGRSPHTTMFLSKEKVPLTSAPVRVGGGGLGVEEPGRTARPCARPARTGTRDFSPRASLPGAAWSPTLVSGLGQGRGTRVRVLGLRVRIARCTLRRRALPLPPSCPAHLPTRRGNSALDAWAVVVEAVGPRCRCRAGGGARHRSSTDASRSDAANLLSHSLSPHPPTPPPNRLAAKSPPP